MPPAIEPVTPYGAALSAAARTCRRAVNEEMGILLPELRLVLTMIPAGRERIFTDRVDAVVFELSDVVQLRPPPAGFYCIYALAHEVAHIALARLLRPGAVAPVVWDEAIAHFIARRVLLPAVWADHGPRLWPDPYPDYLRLEGSLPDGPEGHLGGYLESLRTLDRQLSRLCDRVGLVRLLGGLAALLPTEMRPERFGPALSRRLREECSAPGAANGDAPAG